MTLKNFAHKPNVSDCRNPPSKMQLNYIQFLTKKCAIGVAKFILTDFYTYGEKPELLKRSLELPTNANKVQFPFNFSTHFPVMVTRILR